MNYAWVIDENGRLITCSEDLTLFEILEHPLRQHFRLVYAEGHSFTGIYVPLSDEATYLEPIENFQASYIEYREGSIWKKR